MSERRIVYKDAAAGAGGLGPDQSQLYVSGDKLMGQQYEGEEVEVANFSGVDVVPVGVIWSYAAAAAPDGWLLCDGTEVGAAYTELDALLDEVYGVGGEGRSKLPDLQGRMPLGKSGGYAIGTTGGAATVTLTDAQIPAHSHPNTLTDDETPEVVNPGYYAKYIITGSPQFILPTSGATVGYDSQFQLIEDITHNYTLTNADNTGGGNPFDSLPPYLAINYIIKHD